MAGNKTPELIHTPPSTSVETTSLPRYIGSTCGCLALIILPLTLLTALMLVSGPQAVIFGSRWLDGPAGRPDLAYQILDVAELIWPNSARLHDALGVANLKTGDQPRAMYEFRLAVSLDENLAPARNNLAVALIAVGKIDTALQHLQAAIELDPGSPQAYLNLGKVDLELGNLEQAQLAFQRAVDLDPSLITAWEALSSIALQRGDLPAARTAFERMLSLNVDPLARQQIRSKMDKLLETTPAYPVP